MTFLEFTQRREYHVPKEIPRLTSTKAIKKYPAFWELNDHDLREMLLIRQPHDIKTVEDLAWWEDDREPCFGAKINGVYVSFWWQDEHVGLALLHKHTVTLRATILDEIDRLEDQEDYYDRIQRLRREIKMLDAMGDKSKEAFKGII